MTAEGSRSKAAWIGMALSVVAVGLLLWRVDFGDLKSALSHANLAWLAPSIAVFFTMFLLRAWRWSTLLGGTPYAVTWHANIIGYMFNITLPLRLGEIARAYIIGKNTDVRMARAFSAIMVERILDLTAVVLLFAWFTQRVPMRPAFTRAAEVGAIAIVACIAFGAALVKVTAIERALTPMLQKLGKQRAEGWLRRFHDLRDGFRVVGSGRAMPLALAQTALVWGATIALAWVSMKAFLPEHTGFDQAGLAVVMANLGGALPSAPGGLGIIQGFATSALVIPFGIPEGAALAFVLVWSLGQQLILVLLGLVSMGRLGMRFGEVRAGVRVDGPVVDQAPSRD